MKNRKLNRKELDQLQRLKTENKALKRQISTLRKQLDRLDLDTERHKDLQELVDKQYQEDMAQARAKKLREKWLCHECGRGILKLIVLNRHDGAFYYRRCNEPMCKKRTRLKKHHKDVENPE